MIHELRRGSSAVTHAPARRTVPARPSHPLLGLQQTAGNAAVVQLLTVQRTPPTDDPDQAKADAKDAGRQKQRLRRQQLTQIRIRAAELRQQARTDPSAVDRLRALYESAPTHVVRQLGKQDPVAEQVYDERVSRQLSQEARDIASGRKKTRNVPHDLDVVVNDKTGKLVEKQRFTSGGIEKKPRSRQEHLRASLESHTEAKATKAIKLRAGLTMWLYGQYAPCPSCQVAMQAKATSSRATLIYVWPGGPAIPGHSGVRGARFAPVPSAPTSPSTTPPPAGNATVPAPPSASGGTAPASPPAPSAAPPKAGQGPVKTTFRLGNLRLPSGFTRGVVRGTGRAGLAALLTIVMSSLVESTTARHIERQVEALRPSIEAAARKDPHFAAAVDLLNAGRTPAPRFYLNVIFDISTDFYLEAGPPPHHSYGAPVVHLKSVRITLVPRTGDLGSEFERDGVVKYHHQYFGHAIPLTEVLGLESAAPSGG